MPSVMFLKFLFLSLKNEHVCLFCPLHNTGVPAVQYPGRSLSVFQVGRGTCEPLSNRFETWFALPQWVLFGEGYVLCIIDGGDLGCIKNMGGRALVVLEISFPTSISIPFTSSHFWTLGLPLCQPVIRWIYHVELALFLGWT